MTDQDIVDCLARHGIGWGDEQGVTPYPLDGEDAPIYIGAVRELLARPVTPPNIRAKFEDFARSMDWDLTWTKEYGYSDCNVDYAWIGYMAAIRDQIAEKANS